MSLATDPFGTPILWKFHYTKPLKCLMRRVSNWTGPARMDTMCRRYGGNPVSFLTIHLSIYAPVGSNRSQPTSQPKSFVRYRYCIPYQLSLLVMREKMRLLLLHPSIPYLLSITPSAKCWVHNVQNRQHIKIIYR